MNKIILDALLNKEANEKKMDEMIFQLESKMNHLLDEYGHDKNIIFSDDFIDEYLRVFSDKIQEYSQNELRNTDYFYFKALNILKRFFVEDDNYKLSDSKKVLNFLYETGISPLSFCHEDLRNDFEIIKQAIILTKGRAIEELNSSYKEDRDFIAGWIAFYPRAYPLLNESFRDDFSLLKLTISAGPDLILFASKRIRLNKEMMLELVKESPFSLFFMEDEFKNDITLMKEAIEINPDVYSYLNPDWKNNEEIKEFYKVRIEKYPFAYKVLMDPQPKPVFKKK